MSMQTGDSEEKRAVLRHPTNFGCQFTHKGLLHDAGMMNFSLDGAFLRSPFVPPKGSHVVILLPLSNNVLAVESEVVRTEFVSQDGFGGFAVRFCDNAELSRNLISAPVRERIEQILSGKAVLIFEELGFLLPQAHPADPYQVYSRSASVSFHGPFSGHLLVSFAPGTLNLLSKNMLGESESESTSLAAKKNALGEIANLICESLLPEIAPRSFFYLDAPIISKGGDPDNAGSKSVAAVQVHFGGRSGCVEIRLFASV